MITDTQAIIFDTETTGLKDAEIIEAAWLIVERPPGMAYAGQYTERFKPTKPSTLGALMTHHILDEELEDCRPSRAFRLPEGLKYMIGHNVDFDWGMAGSPSHVRRICTKVLSRWLFPECDSHSQSAMMYHLYDKATAREYIKNAHSAIVDVTNCQRVLKRILDTLIDKGYSINSWEYLWELCEKARVPTVMPFGKRKGMAIKDVPSDYVAWLLRQPDVDPYLVQALKAK